MRNIYISMIKTIEIYRMKEKIDRKAKEENWFIQRDTERKRILEFQLYKSIKSNVNYYRNYYSEPDTEYGMAIQGKPGCVTSEIEDEIDLSQGEHELTDEWTGTIEVIMDTIGIDFLVGVGDMCREKVLRLIYISQPLRKSMKHPAFLCMRFLNLHYATSRATKNAKTHRCT